MLDRLRPDARDAIALVASIAAVAGSFAAVGRDPAYLVSPIERALSRVMPGAVISVVIDLLGSLGQQLNFLMATVATIGGLAVLLRVTLPADLESRRATLAPVFGGAGTTVLAFAITGSVLSSVAAGLPVAAVGAVAILAHRRWPVDRSVSDSRRAVIAAMAGGSIGGVGLLIGRSRTEEADPEADRTDPGSEPADRESEEAPAGPGSSEDYEVTLEGPNVDRAAIQTALETAAERELDERALAPLVSADFYQVSINSIDPDVDPDDWSLFLTGAVDQETVVDFDDLTAMPTENRFVTLRCVSDPLNGEKHDNALWTGVPAPAVLDRVQPSGDCECVHLVGDDDYFVELPIAALEESLFAFGMNGRPLPRGHGAPVRVVVPDRWGEVNAKWITEIDFLDASADGYWEQRGWNGTGPVTPVAKLHAVEERADGTRLVGGHAYAGTRGVDRVEVSIDGGATWETADLSESLEMPAEIIGEQSDVPHDAWRQWAYTYEMPERTHEVVVRMVTADGTVQPRENDGPPNSGAHGWVSREFSE